ncbi:MAG: hypothetical protein QF363_08255 [Planctomycetaceae bacterium]|nr:hypothetical protein [Planctomycetaceae bacterium]
MSPGSAKRVIAFCVCERLDVAVIYRLILCAAIVIVVSELALADAPPKPDKSKPNVTISKKTTRVTGPLTRDGYVDYAGAINERTGKGVTPKNNANVLFWRAVGPHPGRATMEPRYFELMGMQAPAERGRYFLGLDEYLQKVLPDTAARKQLINEVNEELNQAMSRPWQAGEFPRIAQWLKANEKPLSVLVEGTRRSRFYSPVVVPAEAKGLAEKTLFAVLLPFLQQSRGCARALTARALLHAREGRTRAAWQDLSACHRLARLIGQGPFLIDALVAYAVESVAIEAELRFIQHTRPTAKDVAKYLGELASWPPVASVAEKIEVSERFAFLDVTQMLARHGSSHLKELADLTGSDQPNPSVSRLTVSSIDWDTAMILGNRWYDRLVTALRKQDRRERQETLAGINAELEKLAKEVVKNRKPPKTRKAAGELIGGILLSLLFGQVSAARLAEDEALQRERNLRVAFALSAYRDRRRVYPKSLDQLVPEFLAKVPGDLISGKSLVYRPSKGGYLFYSVGRNGKDDGGRSRSDKDKGDDLRVRMPVQDED